MQSVETIDWGGETWIRKYIETYLSGHIYAHSDMETADSCGNCDGGKCDGCHMVWEVTVMSLPRTKEQEELCNRIGRPLVAYVRFTDEASARAYFENV